MTKQKKWDSLQEVEENFRQNILNRELDVREKIQENKAEMLFQLRKI